MDRRMKRAMGCLLLVLSLLGAGCGEKGEPTGLRVAVLGLDGATWDLLDPWMEEGLLPNLRRVREEGFSSGLVSVIPPLSAPAWTTAITGTNPGRHGIFDFELIDRGRFQPVPATSLDRKTRAAWEYLDESGRRSVVIGVPLTTPPDSIEGIMIGGFPHPFPTGYTSPRGIEKELMGYRLDEYGEYLPPGGEEAFLANLNATRDGHARVALELYKTKDWDLFWTVLMGSDKVQHFFWKFMDAGRRGNVDPDLAARFEHTIRDFWIRLDEIVGRFVEATDENTVLLIVSDHGFGPIDREFQILRWLWNEGYCDPHPLKSRVFYFPHFGGQLTVNRTDRFPNGVVEPGEEYERLVAELEEKLLAVRDPLTGDRVVASVFRSDRIYSGPFLDDAPDLLFLAEPGYVFGRGSPMEEGEVFQEPSYTFSAYHEMRGILLALGPLVRRGRAESDLYLQDLAPTVLRLLGETIPIEMDGRPFEGLFDDEIARTAPLRIGKRPIGRDASGAVAE
ncbi:MAG: alkaline phosphatase family protein, partial [Candidatus Eisenbacteria bacterium]